MMRAAPAPAAPARAQDCARAPAAAEAHRSIAAAGTRAPAPSPRGTPARAARRVTDPGDTFPHPWPDTLLPLAAAREGTCPTESQRP
ncbi:hypothetical protein ROS9278_01196 [Roseomonas sp. CECT 9278]|nr:hypothetical protein ROS9278_01196 [Roseomonas sp. CECT 9278]